MTRKRAILLLTLAALGLRAGLGRADEGPIIIAHRDPHPFLTLDPFKGSLGINGLYEMDKSTSAGNSGSASAGLLTEELSLGTSGTIVSGNLLNWAASGSLSAEEDWSQSGGTKASSTSYFDAYDLSVNALNNTPYPISAFAHRHESYVNLAFAGMLRNTVTDYGATLQYRSPAMPSTLNISHSTTEQSDLFGKPLYSVDQSNIDFSTSFQPWDRHSVSLNYAYGTSSQNNPGVVTGSSQHQSVSVNHSWAIDPASRYTLTETFQYSQQQGTYNETRIRLGEQLRLRLLDNLDGGVTYAMERQDQLNTQTTTQNLTASLTHRLFDSLITSGRVGMSMSDNSFSGTNGSSGSSAANYFAAVSTAYSKKVWMGRLGANLSLGLSQNNSGTISQTQQVLGDVQSFNDPQPIILTRTGVNAGSLAVYDASGTRRYLEGIDYRVNKVNQTVQIERLLGGNIAAGDTVRLNYNLDPLPGYSSQSTSMGAGAHYTFDQGWFKGLGFYLRYYQVDQTVSPRTSGVRPDSIKDTTFGAEYRVWKLTLNAEDEIRSSTLAPYNSLRFTASYADALSDRTSLSINASQSYITVPTDHSSTASSTLDGRLQYEIARNLHAVISARWRNDAYSGGRGITGIEEQAELRWNIRQTDVYLIVRHASLDSRDNNSDTTFFQFGLSRSF